MTTRADRLAAARARARAELEATRMRLAAIEGQQRAEERKALAKRRQRVGAVVEAAGLFVLDDATLTALFTALAPLANTPNPVAVLEGCLEPAGAEAVEAAAGSFLLTSLRSDSSQVSKWGNGEFSPSDRADKARVH